MKRWTAPLLLATSLHALAIGWAFSGRPAPSSASAPAALTSTLPDPPTVQLVHASPAAATLQRSPSQTAPQAQGAQADSATPTAAGPSGDTAEPQAPEQPATEPAPAIWSAPAPDAYLSRRELSVAPQPQGVVDIVFPPGLSTPGQHEVTLAIYIDENGHVRAVEPLGQGFRQDLLEAARVAFLGARFSPGELNGQAVKSFILVTVASEETPALKVAAHAPQTAPTP